ncbi:autophagy protein Apg6-domain-containing protein [Cyathus striatus]|nr:autophagy protein Apg6-domain-containing protein [Cyathus striatus]
MSDSSTLICQHCSARLQLDASLIDLAPSAYDMITSTLPKLETPPKTKDLSELSAPEEVKAAWKSAHNAHVSLNHPSSALSTRAQGKQPQMEPTPLPHESFVLLQDSVVHTPRSKSNSSKSQNRPSVEEKFRQDAEPDHPNPSPLSHHLRTTARLFSVLSANTNVDYPLCAECANSLRAKMEKELSEIKKERDGYIAFEKEIRKERERENQGMTKEEMQKKIEKLTQEEQLVIEQLKEAERERDQLDEELRLLELDEKTLEAEEVEFWKIHNEQTLVAEQQAAELASLRAAYAADSATLEKLERTNVYNDAFCIGHDGIFGTINGLRLGRVPGVPVEWAEINAAWGQTLLLMYTIARKLDYKFENYRLVPMGSFSRIEKTTGDKASYELYGSGDLHFGRLLHNRRFDLAMVSFLDCLKHLMDYILSQDSNVSFPHQISKDRIGDVSVKLQFNQEEAWTRALRHVLLALKICLKWTTNS